MEYVKLSIQEYDRLRAVERAYGTDLCEEYRYGNVTYYTHKEVEEGIKKRADYCESRHIDLHRKIILLEDEIEKYRYRGFFARVFNIKPKTE